MGKAGRGGFAEMEVTRLTGARLVAGLNVRRDETEPEVWRNAGCPREVREDGWMPTGLVTVLRDCMGPNGGEGTAGTNGSEDTMGLNGGEGTAGAKGGEGLQAEWFAKGNAVGYATGVAGEVAKADAEVRALGTLKGRLTGVVNVEAGVVRMLVEGNRAVYATYTREGVMTLHGEMPELPWLRLECEEERVVTVATGSIVLSGRSDSRGSELTEADEAAVSKAMARTYARLKERAAGTGLFVQPVLGRYRLLDGAGSTIVTSVPVLLGTGSGVQCSGEAALAGEGGNLGSLESGTLSARGFAVKLRGMETLGAPWNRMVKRAVVEICDRTEPIDPEGMCRCRVANDGHGATVYATLPRKGKEGIWRAMAEALASGEGFAPHLTVEHPLDADGGTEAAVGTFAISGGDGLRWKSAGEHPLRDAVSYAIVAHAGGRTIAAGRRTEVFDGFGPESYATATREGAWRAVAEVRIACADGTERRRVHVSEGENGAPTRLSGLLTVGDVNARELTLTISSGGTTVREVYALRSVPEAGCACYLEDDLRGVMPDQATASLPTAGAEREEARTEPGYAGVFATGMVDEETDHLVAPGKVVYAGSAPRGSGTWDFSRTRIVLAGSFGTMTVTLDGNGRIHSQAETDRRPVASRRSVCTASTAKGQMLLAIAGGDLVATDRNGTTTLKRGCGGDRIGWCGRHNEVWIGNEGGMLWCINPARCDEQTERSIQGMSGPLTLAESAEGLLIGCAQTGKVCNADQSTDDEAHEAAIALRYRNPEKSRRCYGVIQTIGADVTAGEMHGEIGVWGDSGDGQCDELGAFRIEGALHGEVPIRLVAPYRRWIEVHVAGKVRRMAIRDQSR